MKALATALLCIFLPGLAAAEVPLPELELQGLETAVEERLSAAREALESVLESVDGDPRERGKLYGHTGRIFHAHHVFPVAEACYQNAAELEPEQLLWPYLLGFIYQDTARFPEAKLKYQRVLELEPGHPLASLRLARVLLEQGEIAAAEPLLESVAEEPGLTAALNAALGKIATARESHDVAARHYQAALAAQPQASQLHYPLALAYRRLGEVDKAREHAALGGPAKLVVPDALLEDVSSLSVSSQMFLTTGAQALKAERYDLAEKAFRGAIAANPENKRAHLNLAVVLTQLGRLVAAEESARAALSIDPDYGFAYFNLGNIYEARNQLAEAITFYHKTVAKAPRNLKANFRLANALMRTGDFERAARHYRVAVEIAPGLVQARYLESLALIALRRYVAAREVLEDAIKVHPDNVELTRSLARLLATAETLPREDAARAMSLARTLNCENDAENLETLAMALAAVGRFDEAITAQQALLEAVRGKAPLDLVRHLEHNLGRYRQGQRSDQPWLVEEPASGAG